MALGYFAGARSSASSSASAVARSKVLRSGVGSMITGLQTMPSVAWFPLAILLFGVTEAAILFVVVLGAAPSIANGLIAGIDTVPPIYSRAGRVLGARGFALWRHVMLPAALPSFLGGLKQGWAFAWRSLMAGELLVIIPGHGLARRPARLGRELNNGAGLLVGDARDPVHRHPRRRPRSSAPPTAPCAAAGACSSRASRRRPPDRRRRRRRPTPRVRSEPASRSVPRRG